jgi:hypothetical protein
MILELELSAVRQFADDLDDRMLRSDRGAPLSESLDEAINSYVKFSNDMHRYLEQWAEAVFTGQIQFDADVEKLLQQQSPAFASSQAPGRTRAHYE